MMSSFLLAAQRIEVEALIRDSTLNPRAFFWIEGDSETTSRVRVTRLQYGGVRSGPFFQFDRYRDAHYAVYSWDGTEERQEHITGQWHRQALHVARWLAHLADQVRRSAAPRPHPGWQWSKRNPKAAPPDSSPAH